MKLGLVRHFKVITNEKNMLTSSEFEVAMKNYDIADVTPNKVNIVTENWDICYSSTLPRAVKTAKTIYNKEIISSDLLIEVPISPFTKKNIKLPMTIWHIGARIAWYRKFKSQIENRDQTKKRIEKFYSIIENSGYEKVLIVSHGYFLSMFYNEMKKKGFIGEIDLNIKNGKLYTIERN